MANMRLLQTVCAVAMLAAVPAFAQTRTPVAGMTGPNGQPNPAADSATANKSTAQSGGNTSMAPANDGANTTSMAPANSMGASNGSKASAATESHSTHRSAMARPAGRMHGQTDASQDAAVNRLNDESFQSAQQGQAFNAGSMSDSGSAATHSSGGSMSKSGSSGTGK